TGAVGQATLFGFPLLLAAAVWIRKRKMKQLSPEVLRAYDRSRILLNAQSARLVWPFGAFVAAVGGWAFTNALIQSKRLVGMEVPEGIGFVIIMMGLTFLALCWWSVQEGRKL